MIRRRIILLSTALACAAVFTAVSARSQSATASSANTVACRVLESHAAGQPAVVAVVFHQLEKQDASRLGALLAQNSGTTVEIQVGEAGARLRAQVFRLKSCFGRGLLLLPADATAPKDGESFTVSFPARPEAQPQ